MNRLSTKHLLFFILGITVISLKSYSSIFIDIGGRDAWICCIIATLVFILFTFYICKISENSKELSLEEIFELASSKIIGKIFLLLFSIGLFLIAIESCAVEGNIIHSGFFNFTPIWFIIAIFMLPSFFILDQDLKSILPVILISTFFLLINVIFIFVFSQSYSNIEYLRPLFRDGFNKNILLSILLILGSLSSFSIILPYLKVVENKNSLKRDLVKGSIIASIIVIFSVISVITTFGPYRAANIFYPELVQSQRIDIYDFIEFGEFFFIMQSVLGFFLKYIIASYGILLVFKNQIAHKKLFIGVYSFLVFVLSSFIGKNNLILFDILKIFQLVNLVLLFILPLIVFTLYRLKVPKNINNRK